MSKGRPSRSRRLLKVAAAALALLLTVGYFGISLLSAHLLTEPKNRPPHLDARRVCAGARPWSARAEDGVTIRGCYLPTAEHRNLVVLVHGLWMGWENMAALGRDLHDRGHDVLMFDLRGHGRSDPTRLSMGGAERLDVRAALAWAKRAGFTPDRIGWLGQSLGASTLLMEGADNPEIRVVVADSSFASLPEILENQLSKHSHLPEFFNPGILLAAHHVFGTDAHARRPVESVRHWGNRPLLLLHGEDDTTVPVSHTFRIARAVGPRCQVRTWPGTEHIDAYREDTANYLAVVDGFFRRHLAGGRADDVANAGNARGAVQLH